MRRSILFILFALCVSVFASAQSSKFWNISDNQFNALGTITEEVNIDGLRINANADANVVIEANNKSIDDLSFAFRMKTGGGGIGGDSDAMPTQSFVAFEVPGKATVTIYSMSSSSSAVRQLIVSDGTQIIDEVEVPGDKLYKQVINYVGDAATIYIYSRESGLNFYGLGWEEGGVISEDTFWNISDDQFNALGTIAEEINIDGLTINANADAEVVVEANNKSIDDLSFAFRMKMGGGGGISDDNEAMPVQRYLSFEVMGKATITIYSMSSSSSATRQLIVSDGIQIVDEVEVPGDKLYKQTIKYEGPATTLYVYSRESGINIYGLGVSFSTTAIKEIETGDKEVVSVRYYDVSGRAVTENTKGIVIVKTIYTDGTSSARKIMRIER